MNKNSYRDTIEIDLGQFLKKLLLQWRAIVAVGLIFGIIASAGRFYLDYKNYRSQVEMAGKTPPLTAEDLEASMTSSDVNVTHEIVRLHDQIEADEEYINNSIYMNLDPSQVSKLQILYRINPLSDVDATDIVSLYQTSFFEEGITSKIANDIGLEGKANYLKEIMSVSSQGKSIMMVTVLLSDEMDADTVKNSVNGAISNIKESLTKMPHDLELVDDSISTSSDREIAGAQNSLGLDVYNNKYTVYAYLETAMNPTQVQLYNLILSEREAETAGDDLNDEVDVDALIAAIPKPVLNKTVLMIGFLAGVITYIMLFLVYVLFAGVIADVEIERVTDLPQVGLIRVTKERNNALLSSLLFDQFVYRLVFKREIDLSKNENIIGHLQNNAGGEENKRFQILQTGFDICSNEKMNELIQTAKQMEIELIMESVNISNVKDIVSKLDGSVPSVIAVYANRTKKYDVRELYGMLRNKNINVVGELHVEEVR